MEEPSIPERMDNEEEEVRILSYNIWFDNDTDRWQNGVLRLRIGVAIWTCYAYKR